MMSRIEAIALTILSLLVLCLAIGGADLFGDITGPRPTIRVLPDDEDYKYCGTDPSRTRVQVTVHGHWLPREYPYEESVGFYVEWDRGSSHGMRSRYLSDYVTTDEGRNRARINAGAKCETKTFRDGVWIYPAEVIYVLPRLPKGTYLFGGRWEKDRSWVGELLTGKTLVYREEYRSFQVPG